MLVDEVDGLGRKAQRILDAVDALLALAKHDGPVAHRGHGRIMSVSDAKVIHRAPRGSSPSFVERRSRASPRAPPRLRPGRRSALRRRDRLPTGAMAAVH